MSLYEHYTFENRGDIIRVDAFHNHGLTPVKLETQGGIGHFHLQDAIPDKQALRLAGTKFPHIFRPFLHHHTLGILLLMATFMNKLVDKIF